VLAKLICQDNTGQKAGNFSGLATIDSNFGTCTGPFFSFLRTVHDFAGLMATLGKSTFISSLLYSWEFDSNVQAWSSRIWAGPLVEDF